MKALILAGGLGTRLRPLTFAIPKPLIPVGEKPILEMILENLKKHGVEDIYLAVGYKAEFVQLYFQDGRQFGVRLHYSFEDKRLGTAGPVRLLRDRFGIDEPILVMNGDIITELNFRELYQFHRKKGADITVGIRQYEYVVPYGVVDLDGDQIRHVRERPAQCLQISCGIYVLNPNILDMVPEGQFFDMPDLIQSAVNNRYRVLGYKINEPWVAIESLLDLEGSITRNS